MLPVLCRKLVSLEPAAILWGRLLTCGRLGAPSEPGLPPAPGNLPGQWLRPAAMGQDAILRGRLPTAGLRCIPSALDI